MHTKIIGCSVKPSVTVSELLKKFHYYFMINSSHES